MTVMGKIKTIALEEVVLARKNVIVVDGASITVDPEVVKVYRLYDRAERYQREKKAAACEISLDAIGYSPCYLACCRYSQMSPVDEAVIEDIERKRVVAALEKLPQKERQVIEAIYYDDLSISDAARRIGCKRDTVRNRERRAIKRLKEILSEG